MIKQNLKTEHKITIAPTQFYINPLEEECFISNIMIHSIFIFLKTLELVILKYK